MSVRRHPLSRLGRAAQALRLGVVVLAAALTTAASAQAFPIKPDPAAPPGAKADWLPLDAWVSERWLPFDEQALDAELGMSTDEVLRWLRSTGRSLQVLASERGVRISGLAGRLVASSRLPKSGARGRVLRARTQRVLTQPHLSEHMLGHVFHLRSITWHTQRYFGVSAAAFQQLYVHQHMALGDIAAVGGVSRAQLRARVVAAAERSGRRGVAQGALSRRENALLRARDRRGFDSWAAYRSPSGAATARVALCHLPAP